MLHGLGLAFAKNKVLFFFFQVYESESESRSVMTTIHGILQAKILEWVALPFSRGSSQAKDQTQVSSIPSGVFTV